MDNETLNLEIDYLGSSGIILSTEQKSLLEVSLALLKNNEKVNRLQFWGKIRGIHGDYYISKGFDGNYLGSKRFYYSKDCLNWGLLNPPTDAQKKLSEHFDALFTGDPSHVFETKVIMRNRNNESQLVTIKEEDRLACVLHFIERDVLIAPRKALIRISGKVINNKTFNGLLSSEANYLYNYMHIRDSHTKQNLVERSDFDAAIDFMDTIEGDIPKRCWSLQIERGGKIVILKSLLWIGYTFYHVIGTNQFGSLYFGVGQKNIDLPFML